MANTTSSALMPLRVLETCAETQSFEKAANALGVTSDAVIQQISAIEAWVGAPVFKRGGPRLIATEATLYAKAILSDGFGRQRLRPTLRPPADKKKEVVSVSTAPAFASKWLLPRLEAFRADHPDIDIWISVELGLVDFSLAEADIAIRYGAGRYRGHATQKLLDDTAVVMAAPAIAATLPSPAHAADLLAFPLLQTDAGSGLALDWTMWLAARGVRTPPRIHTIASQSAAIAQAAEGRGIALVTRSEAAAIADERLVAIAPDASPLAHWIVWPQSAPLSSAVQIFLHWLEAEANAPARDRP